MLAANVAEGGDAEEGDEQGGEGRCPSCSGEAWVDRCRIGQLQLARQINEPRPELGL